MLCNVLNTITTAPSTPPPHLPLIWGIFGLFSVFDCMKTDIVNPECSEQQSDLPLNPAVFDAHSERLRQPLVVLQLYYLLPMYRPSLSLCNAAVAIVCSGVTIYVYVFFSLVTVQRSKQSIQRRTC